MIRNGGKHELSGTARRRRSRRTVTEMVSAGTGMRAGPDRAGTVLIRARDQTTACRGRELNAILEALLFVSPENRFLVTADDHR